ncbi:MAG: S9 family peptidase [Acidimicrobiales bacterium]
MIVPSETREASLVAIDHAPHETPARPEPPIAERRPHPIVAHGDERVDDWYWLRDKDDPAVTALLEAENAYTIAATAHLDPLIETIYTEILSHTQLTDVSYPAPKGEWAYYVRTVDGKQHAITCRRPRDAAEPSPDVTIEDADEIIVLDENELAEGHEYLEVGDTALSPDQKLLAYATDTTGGEVMTLRIRDLETGEDLDDVIEGAYYGIAFAADNATVFYTRPDETLRPYQVWRHRIGTPTSEDAKVFEEEDERFFLGVGTTKDGALIALQSESNLTSEWHYIPATTPDAAPTVVAPRRQGVLYEIEHHRGELLVLSNDGAVNFAVFRTPLGNPGRANWRPLLAERDDVRIEQIDVVDGYVLVAERGHATTAVRVLPLRDGEARVIQAPAAASTYLAQNLEFETSTIRYETTSLVHPRTLYEIDLGTGVTALLRRQPVPGGYEPDDYRTEQRWATSADGTTVPVTLAWRADRPAGPGPAMLYGYGAYGASMDPVFSGGRPIHPLLNRGFVYAIAHVRGGEELGRHWYLDGKLSKKHHTFEDFTAVAHFLVDDGWTSPSMLAANGGSAGGLLMGAAVNLDPDAFGAVVAEVPFVDCLTTMLDPSLPLTTNEWEEWGDPVSSEDAYRWIKAYSPYDNVSERRYPPILVTGGISDPRVGYFEPTKWVQKLRASHPDNVARVLLRMELSAGHFGPSGRYHAWKRRAFLLGFVVDRICGNGPAGATG